MYEWLLWMQTASHTDVLKTRLLLWLKQWNELVPTGINKIPINHRFFFSDECQTCDCVSQFIEKAGVYRIVIAGVPKYVYCSFEGSYTWTVRKTLILKYKDFYKIINFLNCNTDKNILQNFWNPEAKVSPYIQAVCAKRRKILWLLKLIKCYLQILMFL